MGTCGQLGQRVCHFSRVLVELVRAMLDRLCGYLPAVRRAVCHLVFAGLLITLFDGGRSVVAGTVPAKVQVAILNKIFALNVSLKKRGKVTVLGVWDGDTKREIDAIVGAFKTSGVRASAVKLSDLQSTIKGASVVYTASQPDIVGGLCSRNGVLSATGTGSFVEAGRITVAVTISGGKPVILLSKNKASAEKQEFSPTLLKLAKTVD